MLNVLFLLTPFASHTQSLHVPDFLGFFRDNVDIILRSTGLERRPASLEVATVILGTYEGENDNVCSHSSNEDALDKGVIRHVLWAI